jgi:hypothetical protein
VVSEEEVKKEKEKGISERQGGLRKSVLPYFLMIRLSLM